ncbi:putative pogo transposable element [Apodospora peruviana]|uniref:Pogo transposable element n=1 Tax=Apodospora peruviana TaxID=516989 RepID=A0AAE0MBK1_9PEZI|nr:putative pogo transposable element [Apodospora peruviana]
MITSRSFIALLCALLLVSSARAQENSTSDDAQCAINIPGFIHHGNCDLLCRPATWTDIIVFYLGNYVAHAATVTSRPGQNTLSTIFTIIVALLFPGGGVRKGVAAIFSLAKFGATDLQVAARAGALCAVVKAPAGGDEPQMLDQNVERPINLNSPEVPGATVERPVNGDEPAPPAELRPKQGTISLLQTKIHGLCRLPEGYDLMVVPRTATFEELVPPKPSLGQRLSSWSRADDTPRLNIACSYNFVKILVSLAQLLFAISTLYRTRGDQIELFGYAAFGLTVAAYAWMSFINLVGNLVCPQYDSMFIVESEQLDNLRARVEAAGSDAKDKFAVEGTVGRLTREAETELLRAYREAREAVLEDGLFAFTGTTASRDMMVTLYVSAVPIAIIGGLSRFSTGQSALYMRVWTMMWLVFGFMNLFILEPALGLIDQRPIIGGLYRLSKGNTMRTVLVAAYGIAFYSAPAIGGYVVVAQMIREFGICQLHTNAEWPTE